MSIFRVVLFVLGIVLAVNATSQEIHYYDRITDPRAITRLDNIDNEPVRIVSKVGWPQGPRDPIDGFHILAQDTGAGIITHIWTQLHNQEDSNTLMIRWLLKDIFTPFSSRVMALSEPHLIPFVPVHKSVTFKCLIRVISASHTMQIGQYAAYFGL
jgi:hypothetical protein